MGTLAERERDQNQNPTRPPNVSFHLSDLDLLEQEVDEREKALQHVESETQIVREMMSDFSSLVDSQQHFVDSIESSIETAVQHTNEGVKQLEKAQQAQPS